MGSASKETLGGFPVWDPQSVNRTVRGVFFVAAQPSTTRDLWSGGSESMSPSEQRRNTFLGLSLTRGNNGCGLSVFLDNAVFSFFSQSHKVYYAFTLCPGSVCDLFSLLCQSETSQGIVLHYSFVFDPLHLYRSSSSVNFDLGISTRRHNDYSYSYCTWWSGCCLI